MKIRGLTMPYKIFDKDGGINMPILYKVESPRKVEDAIYSETVLAGDGWMHKLLPGQVLRIVDLEGNQSVDALFYDADNPDDHYSTVLTIAEQENMYLKTGSTLLAESGKELVTIVADTVGCHDAWFSFCSAQSNTVRYGHDKIGMHNCRDTLLLQMEKHNEGYTKRDLPPSVNFFCIVPFTPDGRIEFIDGISAPGCYVEMQAQCRTMVLFSNCSQLNNPCNDFNPTSIKIYIWDK